MIVIHSIISPVFAAGIPKKPARGYGLRSKLFGAAVQEKLTAEIVGSGTDTRPCHGFHQTKDP